MSDEDILKMAVITLFGLYAFTVMTFGLRKAAQTFQRVIDEIIQGQDFCATWSILRHEIHRRSLSNHLEESGVVVNMAKYMFGDTEIPLDSRI